MYPVHFFKSTDSTNRIAKEMAEKGAGHGTAVIAGMQTGGRGRLGKGWESISGKGLYCSVIVRPDMDTARYSQITLVAGVAVAEVADEVTGRNCMLKWPNDLYMKGRKCGGILTESSVTGVDRQARYAIVGIGLNINSVVEEFPHELRKGVTSFFTETGQLYRIREVFDKVREQLLIDIDGFCTSGFAATLNRWRKKDYLLGRWMECVGHDGALVRGIALGPDKEGRLFLRDENGREHGVLSGDVRLVKRN